MEEWGRHKPYKDVRGLWNAKAGCNVMATMVANDEAEAETFSRD